MNGFLLFGSAGFARPADYSSSARLYTEKNKENALDKETPVRNGEKKNTSAEEASPVSSKPSDFLERTKNAPIHVGTEVYLEFQYGSKNVRTKSMLIGFSRDEFIIIRAPMINGTPVGITYLKDIIVRYMLEGKVFGFKTGLMDYFGPPYYLSLLRYPKNFEEVSLRVGPRIQMVIPVRRENGGDEEESILNLSASGALLHLAAPVVIDDRFPISFILPNGTAVKDLFCVVRRVNMTHRQLTAGVRFEEEHPDYPAVEAYVRQVLDAMAFLKEVDQ